MALALGGSLLVKGPVGPLLLALFALTLRWFSRSGAYFGLRQWLHLAAAMAGALAFFFVWALPANQVPGGRFLEVGVIQQMAGRIFTPMEGHGGDFFAMLPFYIPVVCVGFFPWSGMLPGAISVMVRRRPFGRFVVSVFVAWALPPFVLMSLIATKLPHYILPIFPALALALGALLGEGGKRALLNADRQWLDRGKRWGSIGALVAGLCICLAPMAASAAGGIPWPECSEPLVKAGLSLGLLLTAFCQLLKNVHPFRHLTVWASLCTFAMVFLAASITWIGVSAMETLKPAKPVALEVNAIAGQGVPVFTCGFNEGSLYVYLQSRKIGNLDVQGVSEWCTEKDPGILIITRDKLLEAEHLYGGKLPLSSIYRRKGLNFANGEWIELLALGRFVPIHGETRALSDRYGLAPGNELTFSVSSRT
jgi:4-amino-4-deoxy-L-arabinose transferase-like glycosyltransferase